MSTDPCTLSATQLSTLLARRELSSVELVRAHLDRIDARDGHLHAFTTVFRDRAVKDAEAADAARARGDQRGPLHGLPVTVKESIDMAGLAATMGVPSRRSHRAESDGGIVRMLKDAGAVILGRTNVSQYLIYHESRNPIFGQCENPFSRAHGPGGSSGGEGAAIGAGLSPLGIGTDIGGSIRVPAHFCGIAGLKPTLDRWTNRGSNTSLVGQEAIRGQCGPMARTTDDLILAMRALDPVKMSALDPRVPPLPMTDPASIDLAGLRVGVFADDGLVPTSKAIVRAIDRAAEVLRGRGCTVVPFAPPAVAEHIYLYFAAMSADGGAMVAAGLEGGAVDPVLHGLMRVARLPPRLRLVASRLALVMGEERVGRLLDVIGEKRVSELWRITDQLRRYRFEVLAAMDAQNVDVVLSTSHANPALPHLGAKDYALAGSGSMLWNLLQFPAGVVPVTRVRRDETTRESPRDRLEKLAAKVDEQSLGLPVGVQVVTRPWREDLCLAAMAAVEREVSKDDGFPRTPV